MLEQPVNNKGCSSIQFLLKEFYQEYKKVLIFFLWVEESSISWNTRFFFQGRFFKFFLSLGLNVVQVAAYITILHTYQINWKIAQVCLLQMFVNRTVKSKVLKLPWAVLPNPRLAFLPSRPWFVIYLLVIKRYFVNVLWIGWVWKNKYLKNSRDFYIL